MIKITITDQSSGLTVTIEGPKTEALEVFDAVQAALRGVEVGSDPPFNPFKDTLGGAYQISMGNAKIIYKDEPIFEERRQKASKE